jgi:tetratricopeptide (TPR) repeat protein
VELGSYEQALNRFYKVEYMQPDSVKAWRAIAWCAFLSGNREKSIEYYDRLCTMQSPSAQDYLNAGHLYWVIGEVENAVSSYRKCAEQIGIDSFIAEFDKDFHLLKKNGVTETDYPIMIDLIR